MIGILLLVPSLLRSPSTLTPTPILLFFDIISGNLDDSKWCNSLSELLKEKNIKASVFLTGQIVEKNPRCASDFTNNLKNIDIGSSTYNYVDLASNIDYSKALDEVRLGKSEIINASNVNSSLFKAPYGSTNDNIYSLLHRNGITADFSYPNQYNLFEKNQFVKYKLNSFIVNSTSIPKLMEEIKEIKENDPIAIEINDTISVDTVNEIISQLDSLGKDFVFSNPSTLTGTELSSKIK